VFVHPLKDRSHQLRGYLLGIVVGCGNLTKKVAPLSLAVCDFLLNHLQDVPLQLGGETPHCFAQPLGCIVMFGGSAFWR